jgi:hypothetical protein
MTEADLFTRSDRDITHRDSRISLTRNPDTAHELHRAKLRMPISISMGKQWDLAAAGFDLPG